MNELSYKAGALESELSMAKRMSRSIFKLMDV